MATQATVVIGDKQWTVAVANTPAEITAGLSGIASIPLQTGMLFVLAYDYQFIPINMSQMLFPLDIIFIDRNLNVVEVLRNVQPQETDAYYSGSGACYFLEVNAGDASGVQPGDTVQIRGQVEPLSWSMFAQVLAATAVTASLVVVLAKGMK